ncbi:MAG: serine hydrolase [Holosporales bacterium]|jgi:CubicO group peptidase (beta-lactamase class C family)|nr:serine hydrolase [Holosporales bacterium]
MLKIFRAAALALLFATCITECCAKLTDEELLAKAKSMEAIIEDGLAKLKIPGAAFVVSRNGKIIYTGAFGKTTIASNFPNPITKTTLFPVSSLTKNISAILVGALVDAGTISFDDKVRKYLPDFFISNEQISAEFTVLDLISHRSGLKHFAADTLLQAGYDTGKIIRGLRFMKQKPGEFRKKYGYQNIVFGIIGLVLEKATGRKYEDLVKKYIFDKMDMDCSSAIRLSAESSTLGYAKYMLARFQHDRQRLGIWRAIVDLVRSVFSHKSKDVVTGHFRSGNDVTPLPEIGMFHKFPATAGVSLSSQDFAKWMEMLAGEGTYRGVQIVSQKTFRILTSNMAEVKNLKDTDHTFPKFRYQRESMYYCVGFFKGIYFDNGQNGREMLSHMGGIYGSAAFLAVVPSEDIAVGVVCNLGGVSITLFSEYMVHQYLDMCLGFSKVDWIQADIEREDYYKKQQDSYRASLAERNIAPMRDPSDYVGTYSSELYGDLVVTTDHGKLYLTNGIRKIHLRHLNGNTFEFPCKDLMFCAFDADETATFIEGEYGNITSLYISSLSENDTVFKKK